MTQTGAETLRPWKDRSTTSSVVTWSRWAVAGEINAAFSHVSFVRGLASSCSQPLLA